MAEENEPVKPVTARGKAIRRTDAEIDEMTSPAAMEALVNEAGDDWEQNAPARFKTLLGAEGEEE